MDELVLQTLEALRTDVAAMCSTMDSLRTDARARHQELVGLIGDVEECMTVIEERLVVIDKRLAALADRKQSREPRLSTPSLVAALRHAMLGA